MANFDEALHPGWNDWQHIKSVTYGVAACLLSDVHPLDYDGKGYPELPTRTKSKGNLIKVAILTRELSTISTYVIRDGVATPVTDSKLLPKEEPAYETTVSVSELAEWCDAKGIPHPWGSSESDNSWESAVSRFPEELRAAIEAFNAVRTDPAVAAGRSAKAMLLEWLKQHKANLSNGARERIATVANWNPQGGAPKTPG
jgi:hypothetical protein